MSGGHFDYKYFEILEFANKLKKEIDSNKNKTPDEHGDPIGFNFDPKTMLRLVLSHRIIEAAGTLAREIEWLYSSDHDEESFGKLVDKILSGPILARSHPLIKFINTTEDKC